MTTLFFVGVALMIFDRVVKSGSIPVPVRVKAFYKKSK
jgi:hypothetical protein